jgi:hypothetical protein
MDRKEKIRILEALRNGQMDIKDILSKKVYYILPAKDCSGNVVVISEHGTKEYTQDEYKRLKIYEPAICWVYQPGNDPLEETPTTVQETPMPATIPEPKQSRPEQEKPPDQPPWEPSKVIELPTLDHLESDRKRAESMNDWKRINGNLF